MLAEGKDAKEIAALDASLEGPGSDAEIKLQVAAGQEMAAMFGLAAG